MFHRSAFAAVLVVSMAGVTAGRRVPKDNPAFRQKLPKDEQALQALDRLTYGPRPGDLAQVERIGLKKWVASQLHPEKIRENSELHAKLATLPSLNMSTAELVEHYPPPQVIRRMADGKAPLPADPVARMAAQNLVARYRQNAAKDEDDHGEKLLGALTEDQIRTLRRGTPEEKKTLLASLAPGRLEYVAVALPRGLRQQLISLGPPEVRQTLLLMNAPQQAVTADLTAGKLYRAIYSNRQLAQVLDDFWFNHFNVFLDKGADRYEVNEYERNAIQPYVLGRFRDLLEATAKSPAMLFYLDNWQSNNRRGLNENYGRELLELHTLGVDGGYTQKDVTEVARCFTGWTIRDPRKGGGFEYNDRWHDKREKTVLGVTIPAGGGIEDGEKVLDIVASHPATARHISFELAQKFVADNPPQALVDRMSKTFLKTHGDIREVMKTMLDSPEFWSEGAWQAKIKTPFEMVVSAVRATGAKVDDVYALAGQVGKLGEPIYRKLEPTGYSNANSEWVNSAALLNRMNFALALTRNKLPGIHVERPLTPRDLLFRDPGPQTSAVIAKAPDEAAGLALGSPEFQRR